VLRSVRAGSLGLEPLRPWKEALAGYMTLQSSRTDGSGMYFSNDARYFSYASRSLS
jgi:hypothetical protein